jgi:hypothetical protein
MTTTENLLLEKLQKIDKDIEETERALTHMSKQYGSKMSKFRDLKNEREKLSSAYKELQQGNKNEF